jgi:hypothetical protein
MQQGQYALCRTLNDDAASPDLNTALPSPYRAGTELSSFGPASHHAQNVALRPKSTCTTDILRLPKLSSSPPTARHPTYRRHQTLTPWPIMTMHRSMHSKGANQRCRALRCNTGNTYYSDPYCEAATYTKTTYTSTHTHTHTHLHTRTLSWHEHVNYTFALSCHTHGNTMSGSCQCVCHGLAMVFPCSCHGFAMVLTLLFRSCSCRVMLLPRLGSNHAVVANNSPLIAPCGAQPGDVKPCLRVIRR